MILVCAICGRRYTVTSTKQFQCICGSTYNYPGGESQYSDHCEETR